MTRKRWWLALVVAAVVVGAAVVVTLRLVDDDEQPTGLAYAVTLAPDDAQRVLWTDWTAVRAEVGLDLDADSSGEQVEELFDRAFDRDLSATTALRSSAVTMQEVFGFSPASLDWELFTQSDTAATLTMRLGAGVTTDDVAEALRGLGYEEPDDADGVWSGDSDLPIAGDITPELTFIALDEEAGIVFASDQPTGVQVAVDAAAEPGPGPVSDQLVADLGTPVVAAVYDGPEACTSLAMANADAAEQAEGEALVARAGRVNPLTGFGIGAAADGGVRVTLGFDNADQARTNADTRAILAAGAAPGQGGDFGDRFAVTRVSADGPVVTMELAPVEGAFVLSDLSTGPVLFATC